VVAQRTTSHGESFISGTRRVVLTNLQSHLSRRSPRNLLYYHRCTPHPRCPRAFSDTRPANVSLDFLVLESALCGCFSHYPLGLSPFIIISNVPNMISRYTPDLPKQMKCVLTSPSSFLPLYHYSHLSLCVYRLFTTLFSLAGVCRPFQYITNNEFLRPLNCVVCEYGAKNKRQLCELASLR